MKKRLFDISIMLTLAAGAFIVYSNTFDASFHFDDFDNIVNNERTHMEEFGWERLINSYEPSYPFDRPLAFMSLSMNYYSGGLDPFGYHLVNIVIHILTGIGVYFLIKTIMSLPNGGEDKGATPLTAAFASLLWLVSPVQVQAVTYIIQRMTSMAAMFYIYSLIFYLRGRIIRGKKGKVYLGMAALFFILALATKQNSLTLPIILILSEISLFRHNPKGATTRRSVYLAILITVLLTVGFVYLTQLRLFPLFETGYAMQERVFTGGRVIVYYLEMMLFPISSRLALIYDFPLSRGLMSPISTFIALFFTACVIIISIYRVRRDPLLSFFTLWFFINILPETLYLGIDMIYDHRLYLPSVGFYTVLACSTERILKSGLVNARIAVMVIVTVFFSINTFDRNRVWHDEVSLWSDNVKKAPMLSVSHESLGIAYLKEGKLEEAEDELKAAKGLNPLNPFAAAGLGTIYYRRGDIEGAFREFEYLADRRRLGVAFYTGIDKVFYSIGNDLLQNGRLLDAEKMFRMGLEVSPENKMLKSAINELEGRLPR